MERNRDVTGPLLWGLVLTGVGLIFLLDRFGVVDSDLLWPAWPIVFCVWGVVRLVGSQGKNDRLFAVFLIFIGALLTLHEYGHFRFGLAELWPLFLIIPGLLMVWRAIKSRNGQQPPPSPIIDMSGANSVAIFAGIDRKIEGKFSQGFRIDALFGGFNIDLSRAEMEGDDVVVIVNALFGGGEIIVPDTWQISMEGVGIFGGYSDKTHHTPRPDGSVKTLHVRGTAIFGGVEVKNW